MQVLEASIAYFALVFGLGFLLGAIRVPLIVPRIGQRNAELLEMPFMLLGIVIAARYVIKHYALPNTILVPVIVGFLALSLVILAEILLIVVLQGGTISQNAMRQYIKNRDPISGSVYILLLILFALMPLMIMKG